MRISLERRGPDSAVRGVPGYVGTVAGVLADASNFDRQEHAVA